MNFADPSTALLAAAGRDTVKLFDVSVDSGDPCTLTYTPSPAFQVNSVKWNHTSEPRPQSFYPGAFLLLELTCFIIFYFQFYFSRFLSLSECRFLYGIVVDLVVASAGDDKRISLWRKNGQSMGTIPVAGTDIGDNIEVISISAVYD